MTISLKAIWVFTLAVLSGVAAHSQVMSMDITGVYQGTLQAGKASRVVLKLSKRDSGGTDKNAWQGSFYKLDSATGPVGRDVTSISLSGQVLNFAVASIDGKYEGRLNTSGDSISGTWIEDNQSSPLNFFRATAETAWVIPEVGKYMMPNARPEFEVATIKPSDPNSKRTGFHLNGQHVSTTNETLSNLISLAYGVHQKQIVDGPPWLETDKYDIDGISNVAGEPNFKQMQGMYQKLLADRFGLTFHRQKKELSVYALVVGRSGSKLAKSLGDPNAQPDQTGGARAMTFTNTSMTDLALMLQFSLDRPVVDQTKLPGKFDFLMKWTPADTPASDPDSPPGLFTAIQQQLGLKLELTKASDDVIVIDHVEKPSAN
jgi:uncharacterized protein (TIGR03435 family)